jgi:ATP-dependent protease ClpP protease subunit
MTAVGERWRFALILALFAALAFIAWKSGRRVFEEGPELSISESDGAVFLAWNHPVEAPMAERFADAFDAHGNRAGRFVIALNSPGGSIAEGRLVIEEIERMTQSHKVDTHVGADSVCLSMCVPIYLSGETRTAAPSAQFMFHEPSAYDLVTEEKIDKPSFEARMTSARVFERYFGRSEMNPAWRERLKERWRGQDLWFTAKELVDEGANVVEALAP